MEPKIFIKDAFIIAGVAGSGDETAKVWEAYMKVNQVSPLKNQAGTEFYEIRLYPGEGPGKIHVGPAVKDAKIPKEYKAFQVPAATYAEFEINPAKGYESGNAIMSEWLEDNAAKYKEARLDGLKYCIEIYDSRFKGNDNPESVVGIWVPIVPVAAEIPVAKMIAGAAKEFSRRIEQYAGADIREKVMRSIEEIPTVFNSVKGALDYKDAVERLEKLVDKQTCDNIMSACGCTCQSIYDQGSLKQKEKRQKYATEAEFLAELKSEDPTTNYELKGKDIIQCFTPGKMVPGLRCACFLIGGLPEGTYASPTVCQCSRAFTRQRWETILGRPVQVEVASTPIINGGDECVFIIHL